MTVKELEAKLAFLDGRIRNCQQIKSSVTKCEDKLLEERYELQVELIRIKNGYQV